MSKVGERSSHPDAAHAVVDPAILLKPNVRFPVGLRPLKRLAVAIAHPPGVGGELLGRREADLFADADVAYGRGLLVVL